MQCRLQVFCCEVDGIFSTLLNDDALQAQLFGLLDHVRPARLPPPMLAPSQAINSLIGALVIPERQPADEHPTTSARPGNALEVALFVMLIHVPYMRAARTAERSCAHVLHLSGAGGEPELRHRRLFRAGGGHAAVSAHRGHHAVPGEPPGGEPLCLVAGLSH